jgi:uncharacterized membrane protein YqjE
MEASTVSFSQLFANSKQVVSRLATIGENRLELLAVEIQEERERHQRALLLTFGVVAFALLAGLALSAAIVVWLWAYSHVGVLLALSALYAATGTFLGWRLTRLLRDWQTLSATLDQLRKDRACLEKTLA